MIGGTFVRGVSGWERTSLYWTRNNNQSFPLTEKTVITTIHQPSSRLFHKFDNLILLGKWSLLISGKHPKPCQKFTVLKTSIIMVVGLHCGILGIFPVFTAIFTFLQERAMLNKERAAYMYRLSAYFMARTTTDLPLDLFLPMLFLLVVYFMAGLRLTADSFFLTIVFLCIVAAQGPGLAIGALLTDLKKATTLASVTVMAFMLAGRYFVKWYRNITTNLGRARDVEGPNKARETDNRGWCRDRISAKFEEADSVDLIVLYNSGRFRIVARGSLAGLLPFADANAIVVEMANEVLPVTGYSSSRKTRHISRF
ncbi:putative TIM-barrel domain, IGPS, ABC-2 type transporter, aldolase-type TIM barrel [Helianthus annuus]|nr:putative TIM-barrel domain, IGPS, ABC-2 type transporter, aldolase-type TIM barrel [Helianthus annuus]KAJ0553126.1 putative TIM-barrel domain, IGPS, ABC-2 type transporter, aldolase-type TIM barrel [Helianthus annuus]KAJ0722042.1 putative TIM-barrel domain, IGPS, ABC-2 type transporter, aldolase-type TIM barrel [Helianthus annuus]